MSWIELIGLRYTDFHMVSAQFSYEHTCEPLKKVAQL